MTAHVNLHNMYQDDDEPICAFGARLRGHTATCGFTMCLNCNHNVNYTEPTIHDCITKGLQDSDIQLDLLSDTNNPRP